MALESVLLALLAVVAVWLVVDAGRERHRLRARMQRAGARAVAARPGARLRARGADTTQTWGGAPLLGRTGGEPPPD